MNRGTAGPDWERILDVLSGFYGTGDWRRPYLRDHAEDPFQVLIGTILSQRTKDANTERASADLFRRYPDARSLAAAPRREVERLIRPVGFYHTKSENIRRTSQELLDRFAGVVPGDLGTLLTLPGVGPKTANCVLVFGYGTPGLPVDTHVHRIANRLGWARTETPEQTEAALRATIPQPYWNPLNPLLVQHGQNLCRPRNPRCPECPILEECPTGRARRDGRPTPRPEDRLPPARGRPPPPRRPGARPAARRGKSTKA
ncbi:MAG TPA: endonuclease III [Thermoplasmata archaeon]|nr:endonuclease III [Thermoplasmata archaeon]